MKRLIIDFVNLFLVKDDLSFKEALTYLIFLIVIVAIVIIFADNFM